MKRITAFFSLWFAVAGILMAQTPPPPMFPTNLMQGLVAYYPFSGTASDQSGHGNDGLVHNAALTTDRFGNTNSAYAFDGLTSYIDLGNPPAFNFAGDFSISVWVMGAMPQVNTFVLGKDSASSTFPGYGLGIGSQSDAYGFVLAPAPIGEIRTGRPLLDGRWHQLALVFKRGAYLRLFVDGARSGDNMTAAGYMNPLTNSYPLLVGKIASGQNFKGAIDEVRVYSRALADTEVASLYTFESTPPPSTTPTSVPLPSGAISWWPGNGNALDVIGGNNGALTNGATFGPGEVGQAFQLDGVRAGVVIPNAPSLNAGPGADFSVEGWIRINPGTTKFGLTIIDKRLAPSVVGGVQNGGAVGYTLNVLNGHLNLGLGQAPLRAYNFVNSSSTGPDLRDGAFHHVAATVVRNSTASSRLYVDGQVVLTFNTIGVTGDLSNSEPFYIGRHDDPTYDSYFPGLIDEVTLYNRALSSNEIQGIFKAGASGKVVPTMPPPAPVPSGAISWWPANGNAQDVIGSNNGTLTNGASFGPGKVGLGFQFDGIQAGVVMPNAPSLNVGPSDDFSVEAWVKVNAGVNKYLLEIVDKRLAPASVDGVPHGGAIGYALGLANGQLFMQMAPPPLHANNFVNFVSGSRDLRDGQFHHVAATVARGSAPSGKLYVDGQVVLSFAPLAGDLSNSEPFYIGRSDDAYDSFFNGIIDEVTLYHRALSGSEIQAIFAAGAAGKSSSVVGPAPVTILTQPQSQTVTLGSAVTFSVVATNNGPLNYQWYFNGGAISAGTNSSYTIPSVQSTNLGPYYVIVSNAVSGAFATTATAQLLSASGTSIVQRQLPQGYVAGVAFTVHLQANPPAGTTVYAVQDQPPTGWAVTNVSDSGAFDAVNGLVKFGPFLDTQARDLTYVLTPPTSQTGVVYFSGTVSTDGGQGPIGGDQQLAAANLHPADNNPADWRITIGEMTAYSAAWKRGDTWPLPPNPIPITYMTRAATLWKGGEYYRYDPTITTAPLFWVNTTGPSTQSVHSATAPTGNINFKLASSTGANQAAATMASQYQPAQPLIVTISVTPDTTVAAYAVEDQPPTGWSAAPTTSDGAYDAASKKIKWGPFFDNSPRTLSYEVIPPTGATGQVQFVGVASFDGTDVAIAGQRTASAGGLALPRLIAASNGLASGGFQMTFTGNLGQVYSLEYSPDLATWSPLALITNLTGSVTFVDPGAANRPSSFYRLSPR